jgi:beta-glucosidase/6-phospho-beta-glucosidase/beta-galactosidase
MAPGKSDPVVAAVALHHLALAHWLAVRAFRASGQDGPGRHVTIRPTPIAGWEQTDPPALTDLLVRLRQTDPPALTDLLVRLRRDYGNAPPLITENGVPDPKDIPVKVAPSPTHPASTNRAAI